MPGIIGEGELRGQPANPGSPGKMAVKTECVCFSALRLLVARQVKCTHITQGSAVNTCEGSGAKLW